MRALAAIAMLALLFSAAIATDAKTPDYTRIYKGKDGLVHLVIQNGRVQVMPKLPQQVQVQSLKISPDRRVAGWLVDYPNCCTSYPVPQRLVLVSGRIQRSVRTGQIFWDWCFVKRGKEVAVALGPTHGTDIPELRLFETKTGKLLANVYAGKSCDIPSWAACIRSFCVSH